METSAFGEKEEKSKGIDYTLFSVCLVAAVLAAVYLPKFQITKQTGVHAGHAYVDLGLSVNWATCNVGGDTPGQYGYYFAWSETQSKKSYTWMNMKYCADSSGNTFLKYTPKDTLTVLLPQDDAASVQWGGNWRMPTKVEFDELMENCDWSRTAYKGVNGFKFKSRINGNSIFLPAVGFCIDSNPEYFGYYGYYWLSSPESEKSGSVWCFYFTLGTHGLACFPRFRGHSIRPVCK